MSTLTPNIGLEKVTSSQTIGELQESMNGSGGNMDILDGKIGPVGATSLQAQVDALNSKIEKSTVTLTINSNKLGGNGYALIFGNVVTVVCDMVVNSAISAGDLIVSGCPTPYGLTPSAYTNNGYVAMITSANGANYSTAILYGNGEIHAVTSLTTGYVKLYLTYIKQ